MRKYEKDKIKTALDMRCAGISASETLKWRIDDELGRQKSGEILPLTLPAEKESFMKNEEKKRFHMSGKKFVIGVAAACLLISGAAAAGKTAYYRSSFGPNHKYKSYADLNKAEGRLGYSVDAVENFDNGYTFREIVVDKTDAVDENGNKLYDFPEMWIYYEKEGNKVSLIIDKPLETGERAKVPDLTAQCGDIDLRYDEYTYKFVPPGYELTAEDEANLERDDYYISEGSETVEMQIAKHVTWEKNGAHYNLMAMGVDSLTGEEMLEMAEEILEAN